MSATVDRERKADAAAARSYVAEIVLTELLTIVRARREGVPVRLIADRLSRCRRTIYEREETLRELLQELERKRK